MALVVEDGSIVAGANSYVTDLEFTDYCDARGYTYPATAELREPLLIKAMDYLASKEKHYQGVRTDSTQELSFPRYGVMLHGYTISSNLIPIELKRSQMELAYQVSNSEILINETTGNLTSFSVEGVYSETYSEKGQSSKVSTGKANAYLQHLMTDKRALQRV